MLNKQREVENDLVIELLETNWKNLWIILGFIELEEDSIKFNKLIGKDCEYLNAIKRY